MVLAEQAILNRDPIRPMPYRFRQEISILWKAQWIFVRRVDAQTLSLSTVVGTGAKGYSGDGGPAAQAKLDNPSGLAIDRDGNLYISEFVNNRIRRVDAKSKVITTIAGNGLPHRLDVTM